MGEYARLDNRTIKLGVGEDLGYVRLGTLRAWLAAGRLAQHPNGLEPAAYVEEAGGWRYRWPHVREDGEEQYTELFASSTVPAPPALVAAMAHGEPHAPGEPAALELVAVRLVGGRLWTVARCPACGWLHRLTPAEAEALATYNEGTTDAEQRETMRRLLDGYANQEAHE